MILVILMILVIQLILAQKKTTCRNVSVPFYIDNSYLHHFLRTIVCGTDFYCILSRNFYATLLTTGKKEQVCHVMKKNLYWKSHLHFFIPPVALPHKL